MCQISAKDLTGRVNLKFQYSMTKTFTTLLTRSFAKPGLSVMIQVGTTLAESFVWNFEFRSLEFVWDLDFGAWNFHGFH